VLFAGMGKFIAISKKDAYEGKNLSAEDLENIVNERLKKS
jgi:hypothetical protein